MELLIIEPLEAKGLVCALCNHDMRKKYGSKLNFIPIEVFLKNLEDIHKQVQKEFERMLEQNKSCKEKLN